MQYLIFSVASTNLNSKLQATASKLAIITVGIFYGNMAKFNSKKFLVWLEFAMCEKK